MTTPNQPRPTTTLAALAWAVLGFTATSASAQTELLAIEFNEDDQEGFDLWPSVLRGASESTAEFTTDPVATSGTTTVTVTSSTGFGVPANRGGLVDGSPEGFTFSGLYQDLLHALSPTGFLTLDFSGLNPDQPYRFTLYAWDPGATDGSDKEWTVTGGTGEPSVASVNFQDPLVDNESFALVFDITTTGEGTFQLTNTDGLPQSAINGLTLVQVAGAVPFGLTVARDGPDLGFEWDSRVGKLYDLLSATSFVDPPADWEVYEGNRDIAASGTGTNTLTVAPGPGAQRFFVVREKDPPPPLRSGFEAGDEGWTAGLIDPFEATATSWERGVPSAGPGAAHGGENAWGTDLDADYAPVTGIVLRSPLIDLADLPSATLEFWYFVDSPLGEEGGRVNLTEAD